MNSTLRSVLAASIMAAGSLAAVLVAENVAFAGETVCTDTGCSARGGFGTRDCEAGGWIPCMSMPGIQCSCEENPTNNYECYCHAAFS